MQSREEQLADAINNPERLAALARTFLLDSPPEIAFDRVTDLVRRLLNAPLSLVSLVSHDHQFFKSAQGLPEPISDLRTTPLSHSFCKHVVALDEPLVVEDTRTDEIVKEVQSIYDFGIHSYVGVPLHTPDNKTLGTLCALGFEPRSWQQPEVDVLQNLAEIVMTEIALRLEVEKQRELQNQLKVSEQRYRKVLNEIHDAVIKIDMGGMVMFANPAWEHMLGYSSEYTIGRSINEFLPRDPIYGSPFAALVAHASTNKVYTTHINAQNREIKWFEFRLNLREEATPPYLVGLLTDVTNSYRIEAEKEARQLAEQHLKLKNALLNNMTHEFRTPLSAILSGSDILSEEVTPDQQPFVTMIKQGGEQLLTTIDTVLLYAQAESGNLTPSAAPFDVIALIQDVLSKIDAPSIPVSIEAPGKVVINNDRSICFHVLRCLFDNAFKFSKKGQVDIRVQPTPDTLHIVITDTGIGISEADLKDIFTPFDQVSNGVNRLHQGIGLGLPLAKVLTDLIEGKLQITSTLNVGTTVYIELPGTGNLT